METSTSLSVHRVWFRRWNRHNYSTFCSIGKCVNIGSVRKEIADKSLKKGLSTTSTDIVVGNMERSDKPSEEEHTAGSFFLPEILASTVDTPVTSCSTGHSCDNKQTFTIYIFRDNSGSFALYRIFHILKTLAYG
ncbi:hypothetical protein PL418_03310 [Barnesiella intestinihominis]|uniref:hypothetical protein n=1 Tax=Barnesiella intestinihominis TaxID=487174 RepID=UPI00189A5FB7|nr:hypothetical protein [Barnesiella intestinihominis]MDB0680605.1 hypothetical protein [Barnesiella intestinihominis]